MLKYLFIISAAIFCTTGLFSQNESGLRKVVIIRHGEKPDKGDNLSCQGFNRSLLLPAVLYNKFKVPQRIYVPDINTGKSTNESRMYQTIIPFAVKYNLDIDTKFDVSDTKDLAANILKQQGYVLVVWEHNNIPDLVKNLGIKDDVKWKDSDYDSIWIISFNKGKPTLTYDKENLQPAAACK